MKVLKKYYYIASDSETILDKVIGEHNRSIENGTYYEKNPDIKKPEPKKMVRQRNALLMIEDLILIILGASISSAYFCWLEYRARKN